MSRPCVRAKTRYLCLTETEALRRAGQVLPSAYPCRSDIGHASGRIRCTEACADPLPTRLRGLCQPQDRNRNSSPSSGRSPHTACRVSRRHQLQGFLEVCSSHPRSRQQRHGGTLQPIRYRRALMATTLYMFILKYDFCDETCTDTSAT